VAGPAQFLHGLAQALSTLALYPEGHRSREKALDGLSGNVQDLLAEDARPFSFLGSDEVICNDLPLREMRGWDWSRRLAEIGIQRLQFDRTVQRLSSRSSSTWCWRGWPSPASVPPRPPDAPDGHPLWCRGVDGEVGLADSAATATIRFTLEDEAETIRWIHGEMMEGRTLPLLEAEAVVRGLSVAMHGDRQIMLPLLRLKEFDQYTTTHSMNVAVLVMALAEWVGMGAGDVRAFGVAGLLHDLGKVKIPKDILNKSGRLTPEERQVMNSHPAEGARMILQSEPELDLAAFRGLRAPHQDHPYGYPRFTYQRVAIRRPIGMRSPA
jgi:putative nucleotidyltransferase with HDIG domain